MASDTVKRPIFERSFFRRLIGNIFLQNNRRRFAVGRWAC